MNALYAISLFLHVVATVLWVGGLILLSVLILPVLRKVAALDLLIHVRKRFYPLANVSLLVLGVTGVYQMSVDPHYEGLLRFDNLWSQAMLAKHIAFLGMVGVSAYLQMRVLPALDRVQLYRRREQPLPSGLDDGALQQQETQLIRLSGGMGLLVLAFTAVATAI